MIYTLCFPIIGASLLLSMRSRISSTCVSLAALISIISGCVPSIAALQFAHCSHGAFSGFSQFTAFASKRAMVVLPVPRGPQNKYA